MGINLLADKSQGINLLADEPESEAPVNNQSFNDLSKEDQAKVLNLSRQQIASQYPNMPAWLQKAMLSMTPKDKSPNLEKVANTVEANTNAFPALAGGLTQGFAMPFQGIASMLPGKVADDFSNADFKSYFSEPRNDNERRLQTGGEVVGSLGPLGKMFGALKRASQAARVPKVLQNASALAGTGALATPGDAGDKELGAAGAVALGGAGKLAGAFGSKIGEKVPAFLRGLTNDSTPQKLIEAVQKLHDVLQNTADTLYSQVRGAVKRRGVNIDVNPKTLDEILEYPSMQTKTHKELVNAAKNGDYDALHKLQSSLYKKGSKDLLNDDSVVETRGENLIDLRNRINKELESDLIQKGHTDIAHVLRQGKNTYKQLMDTYFAKDLPKGIGKLVQTDLRLVPDQPESLFDQNSVPMNKFLKQHPEAAQHAQGIKEKAAAKKALKGMAVKGGVLGGLTYGGKSLYDLL